MENRKGKIAVNKMLDDCGLDNIFEVPLELLVAGRGALLRYSELKGADGRIVFGKLGKAIITIDSKIEYEGKRRFTIVHELGHFEMHKDIQPHNDSDFTLNNFKSGNQEFEANQFAVELLMPETLFRAECSKHKFSPDLLRLLAEKFSSSITSVAYRYLELGNQPLYVFYSHNNIVKYWKNSDGYFLKVKDITNLPTPTDSVAYEYFKDGTIYKKGESIQEISKSTWFELGKYDHDRSFFEYCIITPKFNTCLSIVWE